MRIGLTGLTGLTGLLILSGCAYPHRSALTTHEVRTYCGRADGLVAVETWRDSEHGGGWFVLTDPNVQALTATHTNQAALGGGSVFSAGPMGVTVDPQAGAIIGATGSAVGNIIGAAIKTAAKP